MPNIAAVLKEATSRLARKELHRQTNALKKASAQYRRDIPEMNRRVSNLQRKVKPLEKDDLKNVPSQVTEVEVQRARFTAKGLRPPRKRRGLSAGDYGQLIGVTDQTIYNWAHQTARPREQQVTIIASIRGLGKRQARARLEQMTDGRRTIAKYAVHRARGEDVRR